MNLYKQLTEKYNQNKLAHFYLVEPQFQESQDHCIKFIEDFLGQFISVDWQDHSDIQAFLATEKKFYLKSELQPIYQFLKHPALELKRKFIVINHAHKLSELIINKLLKEFEEPAIAVTIFLVNANKTEMLPTLRSRANLIRLPIKLDWTESINFPLAPVSFESFGQTYCPDTPSALNLLKDLHLILMKHDFSYATLQELQRMSQSIKEDHDINNPVQQIQFKLFDFVQKHLIKEH